MLVACVLVAGRTAFGPGDLRILLLAILILFLILQKQLLGCGGNPVFGFYRLEKSCQGINGAHCVFGLDGGWR